MDIPEPRSGSPAERAVLAEYARLAPEYDAKWSFYVQATTRETLARLRLQPTERLLDVGCGTGAQLLPLSRSHPAELLSGVDPVPEMLAIARHRLPPEIELREGWAEQLPFETERFDVVVSCNMFHYVRNPAATLREMDRVLRPGGRLVITDWCDDYLACRVCDWYLRRFHPAHFKVYRERECRDLLHAAGHRDPRIERYKINWLWGLMTACAGKAKGERLTR
ncbi:MAG TPA: methyltransferase domain-containing protein [Thermoanaerobaculia bacterium]|nr:methyltransferase domain-containing protein [Thermoanaerobaculia bacterium]